MLRIPLLAALPVATFGAALAQTDAPLPTETVSIGQTLGMLFFLLVAALIVLSVAAKILIAIGVVPMRPETRLQRVVHGFARVVGKVETKKARRSGSTAATSGGRGGGGSFGGGGASGEY